MNTYHTQVMLLAVLVRVVGGERGRNTPALPQVLATQATSPIRSIKKKSVQSELNENKNANSNNLLMIKCDSFSKHIHF